MLLAPPDSRTASSIDRGVQLTHVCLPPYLVPRELHGLLIEALSADWAQLPRQAIAILSHTCATTPATSGPATMTAPRTSPVVSPLVCQLLIYGNVVSTPCGATTSPSIVRSFPASRADS